MRQKTTTESKLLSRLIIVGLVDRKGLKITRLDLRNVSGAIADYFVVCTGTSDKHVQALAESVREKVRDETGEKPFNTEGLQQGEWVLLDYVDVVVHIFLQEKRDFYSIEELWGDGKFEHFDDEGNKSG